MLSESNRMHCMEYRQRVSRMRCHVWSEDEVKQACFDAKADQLLKAFFITRARNLRRHPAMTHAFDHEFKYKLCIMHY